MLQTLWTARHASLFDEAAALIGTPGAAKSAALQQLLAALDYDLAETEPGTLRNRSALLAAAKCFDRIFLLDAPEAPGLIFLGAEMRPKQLQGDDQISKSYGTSGMGTTLRDAFESCIGEGVELLSQFALGTETVHREPAGSALSSWRASYPTLYADLPPDEPIECVIGRGLRDQSVLHVPVDFCLRRAAPALSRPPPHLLSTGCAAGATQASALLHGLCELIERDAAAMWWRGGVPPRSIALDHPAAGLASSYLATLRRGERVRRTWLLDISTEIRVPVIAAISTYQDGSGFAVGCCARPNLSDAALGAIKELCQSELAQAVVRRKLGEHGPSRLNERDLGHIARATKIDGRVCQLLHPSNVPSDHPDHTVRRATQALSFVLDALEEAGIKTFAVDLTREEFALPVVRVLAPALQIEPSTLVSKRLAAAISRTGGGQRHTGGISLFF